MEWAIVEVFGHQRHAGALTEVERAGVKMLRVLVPAWEQTKTERDYRQVEGRPWEHDVWTREVHETYPEHRIDLGGEALFRVRTCTEEMARRALPHCTRDEDAVPPIRTEGEWTPPPISQLTGPVEDAEEVEYEEDGVEIARRLTRDEIPF